MTGVGGGVIRDVFSAEIPFVLRRGNLYASAVIVGIALTWRSSRSDVDRQSAALTGMALIAALRLAAIRWELDASGVRGGPNRAQRAIAVGVPDATLPAMAAHWRDDLLGVFGELAWQARRTAGALGRAIDRDPIQIVGYRGYGTADRALVLGRVLQDEGVDAADAATRDGGTWSRRSGAWRATRCRSRACALARKHRRTRSTTRSSPTTKVPATIGSRRRRRVHAARMAHRVPRSRRPA